MPFNLTTFDAALQAKLNTASVNQSAQDYLLLTKAVAAAIEVSEGVSLLSLKNAANGVAGLDANARIPLAQMELAVPSQDTHSGKYLTTNGTSTSWENVDALPTQSGNSGRLLTTNGTSASWTNTATLASLTTSGDLTSGDQLYVGSGAAAFETSGTLTEAMAVFKRAGAASSFAQLAVQNATSTSSTDIIAYMNNGNDTNGWVGMGIAGSQFDDTTYGITAPGDGYIFHNAIDNTYKGNLVLATGNEGSENKIVFAAGGFASGNTQMEIFPDQNVHIEIPTPSTSATTGALTVVGGVGVQGDMNIQGDVNIQGTITFGGGGTTVETSNLAVTDPFVFVGTNNQADIVDLAFIGEYATTVSPIAATVNNKALTDNVATLTTSSAHTFLAGDVVTITGVDATFNGTFNIKAVPTATTFTYAKTNANVTSAAVSPTGTATVNARRKFAGIARDASDGVLKAFRDATAKPTSTIDFSEAGLTYAPFRVGALTAASATIGSVTNTEIGHLSGVTSAIQTQLNAKIDTTTVTSTYAPLASPTFTGTVVLPSTTSVGTVTGTELGYLSGVTSAIQTQINNLNTGKANLASPAFTGNATFSTTTGVPVRITNTGAGNSFIVEDETSTDTTPFVIDAAGNVGIGTTPVYKLDVRGGRAIVINPENFAIGIANNSGVNGVWIGSPSADVLQFSDWGGSERMRLNAAGSTARLQLTAGTVLEAPLVTRTVSGTSDTPVLADAGKLIECSNSAATTITVPLNSSVSYPVGTQIHILQVGTGQITVAGAGGVTVNASPGLRLRSQWSSATLIKRGTDTWVLIGDLVP
jgi:hypothetical protein